MKKHTLIAFIAGLLLGLAFIPVTMIATHISIRSKVSHTLASMKTAQAGISLYHQKTGKLPLTLEELNKNKLNIEFTVFPINDGWGNPLRYTPGNSKPLSYELSSYGADNTPGGYANDADICVSTTANAPAN